MAIAQTLLATLFITPPHHPSAAPAPFTANMLSREEGSGASLEECVQLVAADAEEEQELTAAAAADAEEGGEGH